MELSDLKKYSDLSFDHTVAKKNALERARSRQIMAYDGHLFRADTDTINLIHTLKIHHKEFFVLDSNDNPCFIREPDKFLDLLIQRNQESLNDYHRLYQDIKSRKI